MGESAVLMRGNGTVVAYIKKQGVTVSRVMCDLAQEIRTLAEKFAICVTALFILGKNILVGQPQSSGPSASD